MNWPEAFFFTALVVIFSAHVWAPYIVQIITAFRKPKQ